MADKYHNEWIIQDIVKDSLIFRAQSSAFSFLSSMAFDLDNAIDMLEGIEEIYVLRLQIDLMKEKILYLKMANGIGRQIGGIT